MKFSFAYDHEPVVRIDKMGQAGPIETSSITLIIFTSSEIESQSTNIKPSTKVGLQSFVYCRDYSGSVLGSIRVLGNVCRIVSIGRLSCLLCCSEFRWRRPSLDDSLRSYGCRFWQRSMIGAVYSGLIVSRTARGSDAARGCFESSSACRSIYANLCCLFCVSC